VFFLTRDKFYRDEETRSVEAGNIQYLSPSIVALDSIYLFRIPWIDHGESRTAAKERTFLHLCRTSCTAPENLVAGTPGDLTKRFEEAVFGDVSRFYSCESMEYVVLDSALNATGAEAQAKKRVLPSVVAVIRNLSSVTLQTPRRQHSVREKSSGKLIACNVFRF